MISVVIALAVLGMASIRLPVNIIGVFIGALIGTFVLESEYFLNAYLFEPKTDFSKTLRGFVSHKDFAGAFRYIHYNKEEQQDNALNSALFQIVLALMSIFVVYSVANYFVRALILTVFAQSIYVAIEYYFKDKTDEWFWALNNKPNKANVQLYISVLLIILAFALYQV